MKKIFVISALMLISTFTYAEEYWTSPVQISEVATFSVSSVYRITAKFVGPLTKEDGSAITSGCAPTDNDNIVGAGSSSTSTSIPWAYQAPLLNAYNLATKVKFYINSGCNGITGLSLRGVKAVQ